MISWLWFFCLGVFLLLDLAYILYSVVNVLFGPLSKTFLPWMFPFTSETSLKVWWRWGDSNPWPMPCKGTALPAELHPLSLMKNYEVRIMILFRKFDFLPSSFFICLWAFQDSNLRPRPYQRRALTSWAKSPPWQFRTSRNFTPHFSSVDLCPHPF